MRLLTVFVLTKLKLFPATVQHQIILSIISTIICFTIDSKAYLNAVILAIFLMTVMKNVHSGTVITTCKVCNNKMTILSLRCILDLLKKREKKGKPHMIRLICLYVDVVLQIQVCGG